MAAETAALQGLRVDLFDAMPSVGRKFLLAGKGGLNLTHAEPFERFIDRYGETAVRLKPWLRDFGPEALREWALGLGIETFIGSSQRVFPTAMKAAPLLRAWIRRLKEQGVQFHPRHRWQGWNADGDLVIRSPTGLHEWRAEATILALGGASWPHLGSDGQWVDLLKNQGIPVTPLEASNSGFTCIWSETFSHRFAGTPVKTVEVTLNDPDISTSLRGELMITERGLEGGLIYALSSALRSRIKIQGFVDLWIDLTPDRSMERLEKDLLAKRGKSSLSTHLRKNAGLSEVKIALLRETCATLPPEQLAARIKALPLRLGPAFPITEAISSAGGVAFEALDENLMVARHPGLFIAGEMLDWDAPTGGYLLTASFGTGRKAGLAAAEWIKGQSLPKAGP
jgi:uncharacterized flavoprotein (TIGR03862 family)